MQSVSEQRWKLYRQGLNDTQIAEIQGVTTSAVLYWRKRRGLPCHNPNLQAGPRPVAQCRKFLHGLGWRDTSIAVEQGVTRESVRIWRKAQNLPLPPSRTYDSKRRRSNQMRDIQRRVVRAIGTSLPRDIAADAAADLMLAVVSGSVPISDIEKRARSFGNRALQEFANAYLSRSLDETMAGDGDLRPIDMLVDDSSRHWLEEMGATWH